MTVAQAVFTPVFRPVTAALFSLFGTFSPKTLFSNNEQGVWYDPSDLTTLFQDAAGTTPVTAVEQPVGLMLDKSKGLTLGPELVTNGTFDTDTTGWSIVAGDGSLSVVDGKLRINSSGTVQVVARQNITTVVGKWYRFSANVFGTTTCGGQANTNYGDSGTKTTTSTVSYSILATGTSLRVDLIAVADQIGEFTDFDNISVRELPGNHAYQTTSAKRPTLSARYNLLTKTEQFDDAAWSKAGITLTNLGNGVFRVQAAAASSWTLFCTAALTNANTKFRVEVKSNGAGLDKFRLNISGINTSSDFTATSNWVEYLFTAVHNNNSSAAAGLIRDSLNSAVDILVRFPDLRVANDGVGIPAYQRVNTATDYDTVGFPKYLSFNGSSSAMLTNSIDFTGTDKMTVWAGVRKLSDGGNGAAVVELSTSTEGANNGSFLLAAPYAFGARPYILQLRGTSLLFTDNPSFAGLIAPRTDVLSSSLDIAASAALDEIKVRVSGIPQSLSYRGTNAGTGNFGNYPLYIGARAGTSLWFKGNLYSLIVRGAASTDSQITNTEKYVNTKTKAY